MAGVNDFRKLAAWQRADELRDLSLPIVATARAKHDYKFVDQLSDASGSAPRNIAEGFGRYRHKEFAQFVRIAKASEEEVMDLFIDARKKGYITEEQFPEHETCARRAIGTATGLLRYLENSEEPPWRREGA